MDRKSACRSWIIPRLALRYTRSRATATATLGTFDRPREDAVMSQDTLDETFESTTPQEPDEPPPVAPPPVSVPKSDRSKIKNKFSAALASPFKGSKGFHLGKKGKHEREGDSDGDAKSETKTSKRTKRGDDESTGDGAEEAEGGASGEEDREKGKKKKKSGARSRAGALVRRLGSLGGRRREAAGPRVVSRRVSSAGSVGRRTPDGEDAPGSEPSVDDETGSRYDSVEDVVMPAPLADAETVSLQDDSSSPPLASPGAAEAPGAPPAEPDPIATTHPVSTLPFAVSAWKPRHSKPSEIERPIESPSPEDTLRRRIAFVAQASACLSEDREDSPEADSPAEDGGVPAARLSRMVQLARLQRLSGERRSTSRSRSPSPGPGAPSASEPSPLPERTDDEDYEDTEDSPDGPPERGMPPFGNLIDAPDSKSDMGSAASSSQPIALGGDRREHLYKILVIGELGTGKTSIIKRYVHQFFSQHYRATIGVDFALKVLNWDNTTTVRLQLWDIAGQERFGNMTRVYYKEAVGAFVVFDVTRVATFEAVVKWKQDLDSKVQLPDGSPIPCVLLANKCDQQKEGIINTPAKMDEYCKERGFSGWFETSAKENINIEEAARALVTKILFNDKLVQSVDNRDNERFTLDTAADRSEPSSTTKSCAC